MRYTEIAHAAPFEGAPRINAPLSTALPPTSPCF